MPGLLQLSTVRNQPLLTPTSHSKCCSMPHHQHEKVQAHHAHPAAATLASSPPTCSIQDRRAGVQGTERPLTCIPGGRLPAVTGHRRLRSWDTDMCLMQQTNTRFGDRPFAAAGSCVWNSLSTQLRESDIRLGQCQ